MRWTLLLLCAAAALSQQPPVETFSVSGVVVDSVNGRPLPDYSVTTFVNATWVGDAVVGSRQMKDRTSVTDAQGRYRLTDLPPGPYRIFVRSTKGGFGFREITRNVQLGGQDLEHIDFKIRVAASITGRVTDENGEPVVGASARLVSREYFSGVIGEFFKDLAKTDDRGYYTLKRVEPGHPYLVLVDASETSLPAYSAAPLAPALRRRAIMRTYYPNAPAEAGGTLLVLGPGEKREGVDIEVRRSPSYCVEGVTAGPGGPEALTFNIEAAQPAFGTSSTGGTFAITPGGKTGPNGKFRICDLPRGFYRLSATDRFQGPSIHRALVPFDITDRDLKGLTVTTSTGINVAGEVVWDGPAPPMPLDAKLSISLDPLRRSPVANDRPSARVDIPGTFTLEGLLPSEYAVRVFVTAPGVYIKDVTYGGDSVLCAPLRAGSAAADLGLRVVLARDGATLSARTADKDGNPLPDMRVILMPAEVSSPGMLQAALVTGQTDQTGQYRSRPIKPGKYLVIATDGRIDATPESIDNLWRSRNRFQEVELAPGGTAQVTLTPQAVNR